MFPFPVMLIPAFAAGTVTGNFVLVHINADQSGVSTIDWNVEDYDANAMHSLVSNTDRLTVPAGTSGLVRAIGNFLTDGATAPSLQIQMNGASVAGGAADRTDTAGNEGGNLATAILAVSSGDYFTFIPRSATTLNFLATGLNVFNWFALEEIASGTHYCLAAKSGNQSLVNGVTTTIDWEGTDIADADGMHQHLQSTVTITIASPAVVTWTSHGLVDGQPIRFTTTGALPTGLNTTTTYYVKSSTANTFQVATSPGGTSVNTSGTQSGTHTAHNRSRIKTRGAATHVRIQASAIFTESATGQSVLSCEMNAASFFGKFQKDEDSSANTERLCAASAIIELGAAGTDYFEANGFEAQATNITADNETWFLLEELVSPNYCLVQKSAGQSVSAGVTTAVTWDGTDVADALGAHDPSVNNTRIVVPPGMTRVRTSFNLQSPNQSGQFIGQVRLNGVEVAGCPRDECDTGGTDNVNGFGAWIGCSPGDYVELYVFSTAAMTLTAADTTWFQAEFA